jgi:putative transposase
MARISRIVVPNYPHHVTQRGVRSIPVFHTDSDRNRYLEFLRVEIDRFGINILAWCLMTNHVHFIAVPKSETALARAFGEAHRRYARMKNFEEGVLGYLFQGRFSSVVLD